MIEFSLNIDTPPFIPNMTEISKYADGNFGIGENIIKQKSEQLLKMYNLSDKEKKQFLEKLKDNNGLISMEKTIFKSIYETNQPVIKSLNVIPTLLSKFELACAQSLGIIDKSLNPYNNINSLTYQLYKTENVENLEKSNNLKNLDDMNNNNISMDNFFNKDINVNLNTSGKWATVSEYYSTGIKYDNIEYSTEYILLNNNSTNNTANNKPINITPNKPPTIIFGVYDCMGNDSYINLPDFITKNPKFYKNLGIKNENPYKNSCDRVSNIEDYKQSIQNKIVSSLKNKKKYNNNNLNEINTIINDIIDVDLYNSVSNNAFMQNVFNTTFENYATYDNIDDYKNPAIQKILDGGKLYKTFEIEYKGESVCIDPENEYYLQIIRFKTDNNTKLNMLNTPFTNYYQHQKFKDILNNTDYDVNGINQNHTIDKTARVLELKSTADYNSFISTDITKNNNTTLTQPDGTYFYVVEGILKKDILENKIDVNVASNTQNDTTKYFRKQHFGLSITTLIDALIYFGMDVLPEIKKLINYLKNPTKVVINTITDILSKTFKFFNIKLLKKFITLSTKISLKDKIEYLNKHIDLKRFAYLDKNGTPIYSGDGSHFINFLNIKFGFGLKNGKITTEPNSKNNTLIKMLLNTVVTPLKIIKDLIEDFVKKIKEINIKNIKSKLEEIISFKIIIDQFKIENITKLLGISINKNIYENIKNIKNPLNDLNIKDFNFINIPFIDKIQNMNIFEADVINNKYGNKYLDSMFGFLKFFEKIFEKIMDFIYDIINLSPKLRKYISFTGLLHDNINSDTIKNTSNKIDYYTVKFDDGKIFENITLSELNNIKEKYKNVNYKYL